MSFRQNIVRTWRAAWPGGALACLAGALLLVFPVGNALKRWSYDLLAAFQPARSVDEVVLVYLDDISHTRLDQPYDAPWDRTLDARLVDRLRDVGARAIGFDMLFDQPGKNPAADARFADAIRRHGKVVLGATLSRGDYFGLATEIQLKLPITNLTAAAHGWGFVELQVDPDDMIRQHNAGPEDIPSLSWRMATMLNAAATAPAGAQRVERWMNYYGSGEAIPSVSYFKVLDETDPVPASFFRDKAVIVGAGSKSGYTGKRKDQFRNPYTWLTGRFSPGAEVHATALLNLLRGDWLRRPAWWAELGGVLLAGIGFSALLARRAPTTATVLAGAGILAVLGLAWICLVIGRVWSAWLIVVLVQIPITWVWALATGLQRPVSVSVADEGETREFTAKPPSSTNQPQPHIPDYELLQIIGRGAYGEVWLARSVTGLLRAIKIIHRRSFQHDQQFEREFQGLVNFEPISRLHEGLIHVPHVGRNDAAGFFYYVMELADAVDEPKANDATQSLTGYQPRTLSTLTSRREPLPPRECLGIALEVTAALAFLHEQLLLHRDIKPANIIFVNGRIKLADIGLVAGIGDAGTFVGTEGYIPPEGPGTPQADVYSAGKVLYELLTGLESRRFPEFPPMPAGETDAELWARLVSIVRRACAPDVAQRYATIHSMRNDLQAAVN